MEILIALEDAFEFNEIKNNIKELIPDALCVNQYLVDAGSWFISKEPQYTFIDASKYFDDAFDLLRLTKETNAGHGKTIIVLNADDKFKKRCTNGEISPDFWGEKPCNDDFLKTVFGLKKEKKKKSA